MFEITIEVRNHKGEPTGKRMTRVFNSAAALASFYDSQRGHSIEREFEVYHSEQNSGN